MLLDFLQNVWAVAIDAAPWLLLGLLAAGFIKAYVPESLLGRWMGGHGIGPVIRAALIGAPLPLCSCGVYLLPLACIDKVHLKEPRCHFSWLLLRLVWTQ